MRRMSFFLCMLLCLCLVFSQLTLPSLAAQRPEALAVADGIIAWKKSDLGVDPSSYLICDALLSLAGSTPGDWYPIGLGRLGIADGQQGYLAVINEYVESCYKTPDKLSRAKSTEWHRIALAVLACGGNPRRMGENGDIDLIADGGYDRVDAAGNGILGKQGINGFIWGLIMLDSMMYDIPEGAYYTRDDIILNILSRQLADGGWALSGSVSDPDITGMALQALAPYYNSEKVYSYQAPSLGEGVTEKKVRTAIEEALGCLSDKQRPDGGYESWGMPNSESGVQVLVALCSLGIDPMTDTRFIKNGHTVYDGILVYRNADGGFLHSFVYDADNPSSLPDSSNTMASEQALYGMAALWRYQRGYRRLYDLREEQGEEVKQQIAHVQQLIDGLNMFSERAAIAAVYEEYLAIDGTERSYVHNYSKLSELLAFAGLPYAPEQIVYNSGDAGVIEPIEEFTAVDIAAVNALPERLTGEEWAEVLRLWRKIHHSFDFDGKEAYIIRLDKAKHEIEDIRAEVTSIKADIKEKLYPFDRIGLGDRETVYQLYARYMALSPYDKGSLEPSEAEGLLRCKTQVDNLYTALYISMAGVVVVAGTAVFIVWHVKKRKKRKAALAMPESQE